MILHFRHSVSVGDYANRYDPHTYRRTVNLVQDIDMGILPYQGASIIFGDGGEPLTVSRLTYDIPNQAIYVDMQGRGFREDFDATSEYLANLVHEEWTIVEDTP